MTLKKDLQIFESKIFNCQDKPKIILNRKFLTTKTQDRKIILGSILTRSRTNQEDGIKYKIG